MMKRFILTALLLTVTVFAQYTENQCRALDRAINIFANKSNNEKIPDEVRLDSFSQALALGKEYRENCKD
jgi:hypothetical protein